MKLEDDDMTFFVDNYKTAQSINNANLRLQMADGWKVIESYLFGKKIRDSVQS